MSTRPTPTRTASVATVATGAALSAALLGGCGSGGSDAAGTTNGSSPTTPTVTVTVTTTPTAPPTTTPTTGPTSPGQPDGTMTIPPPADDPVTIPADPKSYGQAFVTAWVERDKTDATRLGTTAAVDTAFGSTVETAPELTRCEGAAGSSYCTWEGDDYTMTVRILNEAASQRQMHAVAEVKFAH